MSDYREDLKAYLDGELSPERADEIAKALAIDSALAQEFEELTLLSQTLSSMDPVQVRGYEETLKRVRRRPWFGVQRGVGLAAAVLFLAWIVVGRKDREVGPGASFAESSATAAPASALPQESNSASSSRASSKASSKVSMEVTQSFGEQARSESLAVTPSDASDKQQGRLTQARKSKRQEVVVLGPKMTRSEMRATRERMRKQGWRYVGADLAKGELRFVR